MDETRLGHYQLLRCLGEGGMGRVYLARDTQLERDVAVKVLAPELAGDRSLMARFRVEAIAQARLSHPNIVPIYTFGREAGAYVIVMDTWREGRSTAHPGRKLGGPGARIA